MKAAPLHPHPCHCQPTHLVISAGDSELIYFTTLKCWVPPTEINCGIFHRSAKNSSQIPEYRSLPHVSHCLSNQECAILLLLHLSFS